MLDAYIWGKVERISPEAPVPVVAVQKRESRLGGAANVGLNLKTLGAEAYLCAVVGSDVKGMEFRNCLHKAGLPDNGIVDSISRKTTVKFRIFGNNAQMLRVDEETTNRLDAHEYQMLTERIKNIIERNKIDTVIFQDYDKGVITPQLIDFVNNLATKNKIPVIVDPKKNNFLFYKNVSLIKPNLKEIADGLNLPAIPATIDEIRRAVTLLQETLGTEMVLNTLSEKGMFMQWTIEGKTLNYTIDAHLRNVADVSGAGDTVISVAALCYALKLSPENITKLSNLAGGIVCEEVGVTPVNKQKFKKQAIRLFSK